MSKKAVFTGVATALITPTNENGVDFESYGRLIDWQIEQGINGLVVVATTGEGATLSDEEHKAAISFAAERINKRVPMIACTGSNDTAYSIQLTKYACEHGADGCLVVSPYYNKSTQAGLVASFSAIADASTAPIIIYNIPGRTGVNITSETLAKLAEHPNISGLKEANGDISSVAETARLVGDNLHIYSGNDDQIVPIMSLGGEGVISVLSNLCPAETVAMVQKWFDGDVKGSLELQLKYLPLIHALFSEVNPIPVKAAMAAMGYCENYLRLPLVPMSDAKRENLYSIMRGLGLIK
ncbi:MAG: 4-hydroxy-tetrahydrodipicolinate synthase [Eubacteriales bacterium]|nr:4-hydroxy-tetrahydrodipicolinate synthase [Eubacteriales bacterium]